MTSEDRTCGCFNDLPYFGPVESSAFFGEVSSIRLHRLSELLMESCRSPGYFAVQGSFLHTALSTSLEEGAKQGKKAKASSVQLPDFCGIGDAGSGFLGYGTGTNICVREVSQREITATKCPWVSSSSRIVSLDTCGIDTVWSGLVQWLLGDDDSAHHFIVPNLDLFLGSKSEEGEFLLSVLLTGVASILHFYSVKHSLSERAAAVCIDFTVFHSKLAGALADSFQIFVEKQLHLPVERVFSDDGEAANLQRRTSSVEVVATPTSEEWTERICEMAVEAHERLCDEGVGRGAGVDDKLPAPVILICLPGDGAIREPIRQALTDTYSSEPISVTTDCEWHRDSFTGETPVMLLCSSAWLVNQAKSPPYERLLTNVSVRAVVLGGFCEYGENHDENVSHTVALLELLCQGSELSISALKHSSYCSHTLDETSNDDKCQRDLRCCNVLLLLFRRFLMRYSPQNRQPFFTISQQSFVSHAAWELFKGACEKMQAAGVVEKLSADSTAQTTCLTALGRFLSLRFRAGPSNRLSWDLSVVDAKTIMWSHLLRDSKDTACRLIGSRYSFSGWVLRAVDEFCEVHGLVLDGSSPILRDVLIHQLASVGFENKVEVNRKHFVLSSPKGTRRSVQRHATAGMSTVCRGWYEQAPLLAGYSIEEKQVKVFCPPPLTAYCELEGQEGSGNLRIQCPVDVSYPLIVAHSILHISAHNNCVFLESRSSSGPVPLPASLLQSHTLRALLDSEYLGNGGAWLDSVVGDSLPAPSDASVLGVLPHKGASLMAHCERTAFSRKRKREVGSTPLKAEGVGFSGLKPRTEPEADAIDEFVKLVKSLGRDRAENAFKGKRGFGFITANHELHPYYLFVLQTLK